MTKMADTLSELVDAMLQHPGETEQVYHLTRSDVVQHEHEADCVCGPTRISIAVSDTAAIVYLHRPLDA